MIDLASINWTAVIVIALIVAVPTTVIVVCACMRSSQISQWEENERWGR